MHSFDNRFDSRIVARSSLDQAEPFFGVFNLSLPPVAALNWSYDLNAA